MRSLVLAAAALALVASSASAQQPVTKTNRTVTNSHGDVIEMRGKHGYRLKPRHLPIYCHAGDSAQVADVPIKAEMFNSRTMISPEQAKAVALCAVPGQIASGEMQSNDRMTWYDISLIPNDKKTYTKIQINAADGSVINDKQFGGLRGLSGFLRESAERKQNKVPSP